MLKRREFLKVAGQTTALLLARPLLRAQVNGAQMEPPWATRAASPTTTPALPYF
jgi:hypothetical protein